MRTAAADGPEAWLERIDKAERVAVHDEGADDEERLAACAHVLGFAPGTGLDRAEVSKQFHRLALTATAPRQGASKALARQLSS